MPDADSRASNHSTRFETRPGAGQGLPDLSRLSARTAEAVRRGLLACAESGSRCVSVLPRLRTGLRSQGARTVDCVRTGQGSLAGVLHRYEATRHLLQRPIEPLRRIRGDCGIGELHRAPTVRRRAWLPLGWIRQPFDDVEPMLLPTFGPSARHEHPPAKYRKDWASLPAKKAEKRPCRAPEKSTQLHSMRTREKQSLALLIMDPMKSPRTAPVVAIAVALLTLSGCDLGGGTVQVGSHGRIVNKEPPLPETYGLFALTGRTLSPIKDGENPSLVSEVEFLIFNKAVALGAVGNGCVAEFVGHPG